jgi:NAD(P)H-quinone oxidoreductase subunit L
MLAQALIYCASYHWLLILASYLENRTKNTSQIKQFFLYLLFNLPRGNNAFKRLGIQPMMGNSTDRSFLLKNQEIMVVALVYLISAGAYLLVVPAAVLFYLNQRWYVASSVERAFMYFLVFFFFPGLLLLSPFVNLRPRRRQIEV